ncbi:VCBS repeat-containing protein [Metabacillus sp. FJAT-53654]|uniref:VCBS repeat-containing protein n=1 Tax=Metabacillus rhizosphaerae TaxID=3117747 RepID=A0ABZ2MMG4_9BACI
MENRGTWKLLLYISLGILLSGCSMVKSPSELIESPQPQDVKKIKLQHKLNQLLPSEIEFMTAKQGATNQSIFMRDINGDGKQEAFILYRSLKGNQQVQLLVLQESKEDWTELSAIETNYHTLDYFSLQDLDSDGVMEMVIGLGGATDFETEKQLVIYKWDTKGLKKEIEQSFDEIDIADYDGDEKKDVLLINGKRRESFTAEMFYYQKGELRSRSVISLNSFSFHEKIVSGKLNDGHKALFIDSAIGVHSMLTEIIAFDNGELVNVGDENGGITYKDYPLYSKDINGDGVTDVGGMYIPKGWEDTEFSQIPFIEFYSTYSIDGASKKVEERFTDRVRRFYIKIPSAWHGKVTIEEIQNGIQLISISNEQLVFEVKWASEKSWDSSKKVLKETKDTIFYSDMKENQTFPFDQFHLLENEF